MLTTATLLMSLTAIPYFQDEEIAWPTKEWPRSTPQAAGVAVEALKKIDAEMRAGDMGLMDSLLVIRHGKIVFEAEYEQDYENWTKVKLEPAEQYNYFHPNWHPFYKGSKLHTMQSVSKSVTSLLIGIAIAQGKIESTDVAALSFFEGRKFPDPDGRKARIKIEDVLTMRSGFAWDEWSFGYEDPRNDCIQLEACADWIDFVLNKPMAADPGEVFVYNSGSTVLLSGIIKQATGMTIDKYAEEHLFGPLGIASYHWKKTPKGLPDTEGGLYLLPTDLAKLGLLCLHDGEWDGQRILPAGWVERSLTPWVKDINPRNARKDPGYGYKWWILDSGEGDSPKTYAAMGFGGQNLIVAPELELIVVFTAWNIAGPGPSLPGIFAKRIPWPRSAGLNRHPCRSRGLGGSPPRPRARRRILE